MLIFRYTYSIFEVDSKVTFTKTLFLLADSNITTPCPLHVLKQMITTQYIVATHNMPMSSGTGTRAERSRSSSSTKSSKRLSHQTFSRAIDLSCRACDAGAGAKTSNSELDFPAGEPSVLLPQPPTVR